MIARITLFKPCSHGHVAIFYGRFVVSIKLLQLTISVLNEKAFNQLSLQLNCEWAWQRFHYVISLHFTNTMLIEIITIGLFVLFLDIAFNNHLSRNGLHLLTPSLLTHWTNQSWKHKKTQCPSYKKEQNLVS